MLYGLTVAQFRGGTEQMLYSRLKIDVYLSFMQLSDM